VEKKIKEVEEGVGLGCMEGDLIFRGHIQFATHIYKIAIMGCKITKMPLLDLKYWPIHSNDMEMTWK